MRGVPAAFPGRRVLGLRRPPGDADARRPEPAARNPLARLDHLVYAAPRLETAIDDLERRLGVRAETGGSHAGEGTRNALLALGPTSYLEILAPDPSQPAPGRPRWFGLDGLDAPRLAAWAVRETDLERAIAEARRGGVALPNIASGGRRRPDGATLSWRFTDPHALLEDGLVPFFIDWGSSPHPARGAPLGARLTDLHAEHPEPERLREIFRRLRVSLAVEPGPRSALVATVEGPRGRARLV